MRENHAKCVTLDRSVLTFHNIKKLAKSNNIELSEKFIAMWSEEQTLWDVMFLLYPDKNKKDKSLKRMLAS